jgi:hypothetical protein
VVANFLMKSKDMFALDEGKAHRSAVGPTLGATSRKRAKNPLETD